MKLHRFNFAHEFRDERFDEKKKKQAATIRIDAEIKKLLDEFAGHDDRRRMFERLIACVRSRTGLLKPTPGGAGFGWAGPVFLLGRLRNLAARHRHWLRSCETWRPCEGRLRPVLRSLSLHLLALYPVPGFMESVWDLPAGPEGFRQQAWYIRLGRGARLRELNLPLVLTRRMEHHARLAPDHFMAHQALRYGEARGAGVTEPLAREIAAGHLGRKMENPQFWLTVARFFAAYPEMPVDQVNPIIDFVQYHKFALNEFITADGVRTRPAPWPNFSLQGRTLKSVLRLVHEWHEELPQEKWHDYSWRCSGLQGYRFLEKRAGEEGDLYWSVEELLSSAALREEGRVMRHCAAIYAQRCRQGATTIWSLRLRVKDQEKRMATVEVDPRDRSIIQARAKCNACPGGQSFQIIKQWAAWSGLSWALRS